MFGDKLKELRKNKKISQEDIANKFEVTISTVSAWENNKAQPNYDTLKELAEYFEVTTDYLLDFNQNDKDKIEKLNTALKEVYNENIDMTPDEIKMAFDQFKQYREMYGQMFSRINNIPNKYPNRKNEDTN